PLTGENPPMGKSNTPWDQTWVVFPKPDQDNLDSALEISEARVGVYGDRWVVDLASRTVSPRYWKMAPSEVVRALWHVDGTTEDTGRKIIRANGQLPSPLHHCFSTGHSIDSASLV
ncbi:Vacuolar protein sorting-associated protein ist1, partial [Perkinsus olseni]